jgi:alpha-1,3-rhamnosyl/mannosyltransferase
VLAFPSVYEGFGLPLLEGFASATPVVSASGSALTEIAGGAALEVDALSIESMATGLRTMLDDADLRAAHVARGLRRVQAFSWSSCVEQTVQVYSEVASQ